MSIIYDALRKAEREHEPVARGLALCRETRATRRRWKRLLASSLLIGATTLAALSTWTWLQSQGFPFWALATAPSAPVREPDRADPTDRQGVARASNAVAPTPEAVARSQLNEVPSVPVPEAHDSAESAFTKARQAESDGQWDQAIHHYRQAIALNPTLLEARNNLGNLFIHRRQIAAAIEEYQAALTIDPNYVLARNNLGSAYFLSGEEGLAIQEFLAALRIDGAYVSPYYNLASLYARRGDVGQSIAFLTKALAIEPAVLSWLQADPDFDGVRGTPEFRRLRVQKHARR